MCSLESQPTFSTFLFQLVFFFMENSGHALRNIQHKLTKYNELEIRSPLFSVQRRITQQLMGLTKQCLRPLQNFASECVVTDINCTSFDWKYVTLYNIQKWCQLLTFECHIISNQHKRRPLLNVREAIFSHPFHGLVKRFTCTFSTNKVLVKSIHKLHGSFVFYSP